MLQKIAFLILLLPLSAFAQNEAIFPNLSGDDLIVALVDAYKPDASEVMSYGEARDILFGIIDRQNDSISCIYSQHQVYLPDGVDPTTYIFQNGSPNGINTEHTFPQSMGAEFGAAKSDMHHLFPARVEVNSARGSLPFADIQDFETDWWYYKNTEQSSIPSFNKDAYSEGTNARFEPREGAKGDIARAVFYFYTMYDSADDNFFNQQKNTLCQWHFQDPADQIEINRTNLIAVYQGEKVNPFVLDCSLVARTYCESNPDCPITATKETLEPQLRLFPNPVQDMLQFSFIENSGQVFQVQLFDINGILQLDTPLTNDRTNLDLSNLVSGIYFYQILGQKGEMVQRGKLIK